MIKRFLQKMMPTLGAQRYSWRHDGLIHCMEARRGKGKSYCLTSLTKWAVAKRIPILTNADSIDYYRLAIQLCMKGVYNSLPECLDWMVRNISFARHWDDILLSHDCILILDEATRLFDGRSGFSEHRTPPVLFDWFHQSRKVRVTVWLATHNIMWLDNRVTSVLDLFWMVKKITTKKKKAPDGTNLPVSFHLYGNDAGGAGKLKDIARHRADFIMSIPFQILTAQIYDSWEIIKKIQGTPAFPTMTELQARLVELGIINPADAHTKLTQHLKRVTFHDSLTDEKTNVKSTFNDAMLLTN